MDISEKAFLEFFGHLRESLRCPKNSRKLSHTSTLAETDPRHVSQHLVGFEALEVLTTHDMGHSRMKLCCADVAIVLKLCCADVAIVLSEMRTRME